VHDIGSPEGRYDARVKGIANSTLLVNGEKSFRVGSRTVELLYDFQDYYTARDLDTIVNERLALGGVTLEAFLYAPAPLLERIGKSISGHEDCSHDDIPEEIQIQLDRGGYVYLMNGRYSAWSQTSNRMTLEIIRKYLEANPGRATLEVIDFGTPQGGSLMRETGDLRPRVEMDGLTNFKIGDRKVILIGQMGEHFTGKELLEALDHCVREAGEKSVRVRACVNLTGQDHLKQTGKGN